MLWTVIHNLSSRVSNHNYNRELIIEMSLFKKRAYYKPFDYDWAFNHTIYNEAHWLPSEVPLHEDVRDWKKD